MRISEIATLAFVAGLVWLGLKRSADDTSVPEVEVVEDELVKRYQSAEGPFRLRMRAPNGNEMEGELRFPRFDIALKARNDWCAEHRGWRVWIMRGSGGLIGTTKQC